MQTTAFTAGEVADDFLAGRRPLEVEAADVGAVWCSKRPTCRTSHSFGDFCRIRFVARSGAALVDVGAIFTVLPIFTCAAIRVVLPRS